MSRPYDAIGLQPTQMPMGPMMGPIGFADMPMTAFGAGPMRGSPWPVNVSTRPMSIGSGEFADCGVLIPPNTDGDVLPLMGRQLQNRKWQFYCISNQRNGVRLQIYVGGNSNGRREQGNRNAMQENGIDEIYDGDKVTVQGKGPYRVQMYDNAAAYLPYL